MIKEKKVDHNVAVQFNILIPVGIAIIDVLNVKYDLVSKSKPTINIWWPQTIQPNNEIINKAINIESRPNIIHWVNLDIISLIKPNAGKINIYTSGCPKNQNKCWNNNKSPPLIGSKNEQLKCLSNIIIVITPANTGKLIINKKAVKNIDQEYKGKNKNKLIIDRLVDFNNVTIKLIDPNKELNPIICKEKNIISIDE